MPCNYQNVRDNTIFEYYSRDTGIGVGFESKNFDILIGDTDSGNYVDGNLVKWGSNVYIGNVLSLERQTNVDIKGKCSIKGSISKVGDNRLTVSFTYIQLVGVLNKIYEHLAQFGLTNVNYRENLTISNNTIIVKCDDIGNLSGNCTIEMRNVSYNNRKRTIEGHMTVSIYGTIKNPIVEILGAAWDITDWSIDFGTELDNPEGDIPAILSTPDDDNFNIFFPADEVPLD